MLYMLRNDTVRNPIQYTVYITQCTVRLVKRCQVKPGISRKPVKNVMFCTARAGGTKPFKNLRFLNDSIAGSRRNTGNSVGTFESLRNHCQQQLVALFTPASRLGGWQGDPLGTVQDPAECMIQNSVDWVI